MNELVRERIARNRSAAGDFGAISPFVLPDASSTASLDYQRQDWSLAELMCYYDRDFVQTAYLVLLKRNCDMEGLEGRLKLLQSGAMSRVELLFRLRYGPEGKQHRTRVRGLVRAFLVDRVCRLPVVGWLPRYLRALARLPGMQRELEEIRGLIAMQKNDSDERDRKIVASQNIELEKIRRRLGR
jgi:O-antigen chain-terminating methyltransferase